ncbi:MAG TPA: dNTP triphosphohydrolase [Candidatus Aquilonibacter sp.]|nr:dNTP triphosphohydrolase [Candidatus Aquilonibacter sp.]
MSLNLHGCGVFGAEEQRLARRVFPAPAGDGRSPFERDRDRVVQSRAFRRLAGKTQVFTSRASDHFRSRLTHTIEVAQVARQIAAALGLNADLAETLALVHDIGHPPFGHAGERALDRCLRRHGLSFDHNLHALRIVEHFEQRYAGHRGLNLTLATREGIIKHSRDYDVAQHPELAEYFLDQRPPLEAQIIDLADEIAYLTADLDDGVESGLLEIDHAVGHVRILRRSFEAVRRAHPAAEDKYVFHDALQTMQKTLVLDLVRQTAENVRASAATTLAEIRALPMRVARLSPQAEEERGEGKRYLFETLYTCPLLEREHAKAEAVVTELFDLWVREPEQLPGAYTEEIEAEGAPRVAADYIAGMTDNFILQQYEDARECSDHAEPARE